MAKSKRQSFTSPKGRVGFAHLDRPNTKFKPQGEFSVELILDGKDASDYVALLTEKAKAARERFLSEAKTPADRKKLEKYKIHIPIQQRVDKETGEDIPGEFILKVAADASGEFKSGPKKGEKWNFRPVIVDSKRQPMKHGKIGRDSIVRVSFSLGEYAMPSTEKIGVKAYLEGVQVLDFKPWGGRSAEDMFNEEDGFVDTSEEETDHEAPAGEAKPAAATEPGDASEEEIPF